MKKIQYITDKNNKRLAVQIPMSVLQNNENDLVDLLDTIIAESRAEEPKRTYESFRNSLKKKKLI